IFEVKGIPGADLKAWLSAHLKSGRIGFDPKTHTIGFIRQMEGLLPTDGFKLVPTRGNLVDRVWGKERPAAPNGAVRVHPLKLAGQSS
ncbi:hypothetical protein AAEH86_22085, partial [Shewanella algae]